MKLSVQNIVDYLEEQGYTVHSSIVNNEAYLTACRWLYQDSFRHGILYVEPPDSESVHSEHMVIAVTYGNDILRVDAASPREVFNAVNAAFYYYTDWERRLLECLLFRKSLQDLIGVADEVFQAPMIVDGIDGQCYGITKNYSPEIHETWRLRLFNDAASYDFVRRNAHRPFFIRLVKSTYPTFNASEVWPGNTMHSNFYYKGRRAGFIVLYEYQHKMRPGDLHYLNIFARVVEQYMEQNPEYCRYNTYLEFFLYSAITFGADNWEKLEIVFRYNHWNYNDTYCVYYLIAKGNMTCAKRMDLLQKTVSDIQLNCQDAVCVPVEDEMVVLVNLRSAGTEAFLAKQLKPYHAGRSMEFKDIRKLRNYYRQALEVARQACRTKNALLKAEQCVSWHVSEILKNNNYAKSLIPRELMQLYNYDMLHGTKLFKTLRAYYMCNLNNTDTAAFLHLHRNTMIQRLQKIRLVMGKDPEYMMEKIGYCGILAMCCMLDEV